jgi:hypothetical protein
MERDPALILYNALNYIAARYGGTLAHHILSRALRDVCQAQRASN